MAHHKRYLRVFLCHSSHDKPIIRKLYQQLIDDGIDAWLDEEKLIPGQDWHYEISKAVEDSDAIIVCLSPQSVTKEGYIQREIRFALDVADEKPEGTIFIIPARLEYCDIPQRIKRLQWVDLFSNDGYARLLKALQICARRVGATLKRKKKTAISLRKELPANLDNAIFDMTGKWRFHETYQFGTTTGIMNIVQNESLLSGTVTLHDITDDGDEIVFEEEVEGTINGNSLSLNGVKVKVVEGFVDQYNLDRWVGLIENSDLISGYSEDSKGVSGRFTLDRVNQK